MNVKNWLTSRQGSRKKLFAVAAARGSLIIAGLIVFGVFVHDYTIFKSSQANSNPPTTYPISGYYGIFLTSFSILLALALVAFKHTWPADFAIMIGYVVLFGIYAVKAGSSGSESDNTGDKATVALAAWTACAAFGLWAMMFCFSFLRWWKAKRAAKRNLNEVYKG